MDLENHQRSYSLRVGRCPWKSLPSPFPSGQDFPDVTMGSGSESISTMFQLCTLNSQPVVRSTCQHLSARFLCLQPAGVLLPGMVSRCVRKLNPNKQVVRLCVHGRVTSPKCSSSKHWKSLHFQMSLQKRRGLWILRGLVGAQELEKQQLQHYRLFFEEDPREKIRASFFLQQWSQHPQK